MKTRVMPLGLTTKEALAWSACTSKRKYATLAEAGEAAKNTGDGVKPYRCKVVYPAHWHIGHWRQP